MNVTGIDATYYVVTDIDGTTKFYTQLLGSEPAMRHGPVSEWTFSDGSSFGLYQSEQAEKGSNGSALFAVPDINAAIAKAKADGVHFHQDGEVTDTPVCFMAFGEDSEGNQFILHTRKSG
jgi:predicted enzyme related to lactoylglutathione lyase